MCRGKSDGIYSEPANAETSAVAACHPSRRSFNVALFRVPLCVHHSLPAAMYLEKFGSVIDVVVFAGIADQLECNWFVRFVLIRCAYKQRELAGGFTRTSCQSS